MNEQKPEDVMKALELCNSFRDLHACDVCPYFRAELGDNESCTNRMAQDALALLRKNESLIEVLAKNNADLEEELAETHNLCEKKDAEIERLQSEITHLEGHREDDIKAFKTLKADTVWKMRERLKAEMSFGRYIQMDKIDQIGKTVFFTREEAEIALAERSNENDE